MKFYPGSLITANFTTFVFNANRETGRASTNFREPMISGGAFGLREVEQERRGTSCRLREHTEIWMIMSVTETGVQTLDGCKARIFRNVDKESSI